MPYCINGNAGDLAGACRYWYAKHTIEKALAEPLTPMSLRQYVT